MTKERWTALCNDCGDVGQGDTQAEAVRAAEHHINSDIGDENPRPYRYHVVTIVHTVGWEGD